MDGARARRLADRIARIVAEMLERRIKDPRLGFVTVTDVRLTGDLRDATVYYTVYGPAEDHAATSAALESAKGVIRSEVGRQTGLRYTPTLTFVTDTVPDTARHIEELLERARVADAEVARNREGASPAGDPDPYRLAPEPDGEAGGGDGGGDGAAPAGPATRSGGPVARSGGGTGQHDLAQFRDGFERGAGYSPS